MRGTAPSSAPLTLWTRRSPINWPFHQSLLPNLIWNHFSDLIHTSLAELCLGAENPSLTSSNCKCGYGGRSPAHSPTGLGDAGGEAFTGITGRENAKVSQRFDSTQHATSPPTSPHFPPAAGLSPTLRLLLQLLLLSTKLTAPALTPLASCQTCPRTHLALPNQAACPASLPA